MVKLTQTKHKLDEKCRTCSAFQLDFEKKEKKINSYKTTYKYQVKVSVSLSYKRSILCCILDQFQEKFEKSI